MSAMIRMLGRRFDRLKVLRAAKIDKWGVHYWLCLCDCGEKQIVPGSRLRSGQTKSCGCLKLEIVTTHGLSKSKIYRIWGSMISRCSQPKDSNYKWYGAKGIKVCRRWQKFENFYADMGDIPRGLEIH